MSFRVDDGLSTQISFALAASAGGTLFWEKEVTPPGIEGGGPIDTTTMRNVRVRTKSPKQLYTVGDTTATVAYNPVLYTTIISMINRNQLITVKYADNTTKTFYGWLDEFKPNPVKEGEQPTAMIKICAANQDRYRTEQQSLIIPGGTPPPN